MLEGRLLHLWAVAIAIILPSVSSHPVKPWPTVPNRQTHWSGFQRPLPNAALPKSLATVAEKTKQEARSLAATKAKGYNNGMPTYRPDSWSKYNYHLEKRDPQQRDLTTEQPLPPPPQQNPQNPPVPTSQPLPPLPPSLSSSASSSTPTCNASLTPHNYCPLTGQDVAGQYTRKRRGLFIGTGFAIFGAALLFTIWCFNYNFFKYFKHKDRWYVENARYRSIVKVNQMLERTGVDEPFPENINVEYRDTVPSRFWATIYENETFIRFLFWFEKKIEAEGKYTNLMDRPKLGDEASGVPLNSSRARIRYGKGGKGKGRKRAVSGGLFGKEDVRKASGTELPTPVGSLHRRSAGSRSSIVSLPASFFSGKYGSDATRDDEYEMDNLTRRSGELTYAMKGKGKLVDPQEDV